MKKTGELLRKAREEKKLSLHEIGLSLKISTKVLRAIEDGDESQLPAKTFLRGFVQSYANYLGLSSDRVLDVFYEEMGSTKPRPYIRPADSETSASSTTTLAPEQNHKYDSETVNPEKLGQSKDVRSLNQRSSKTTILVFVIGAVLVGLILFTKRMIDKYTKEAEVPQEEVAQTIEGATPLSADAENSTETLTPNSEPNMSSPPESSVNTTESASKPLAPVSTPTSAPIGLPIPPKPTTTPVATPVPSATVTPVATPRVVGAPIAPLPSATPTAASTPAVSAKPTATTATSTPTPAPAASPAQSPPPLNPAEARPVELIVEALDAVEIEYSAPNGKLQKIKLSPEQVHTFKSRSGLSIQFSNGGAVNLILNGKDLGIPGDLGKSIKLSY